jgi:hypothetical protein
VGLSAVMSEADANDLASWLNVVPIGNPTREKSLRLPVPDAGLCTGAFCCPDTRRRNRASAMFKEACRATVQAPRCVADHVMPI